MATNLKYKLITSLREAAHYDSGNFIRPAVILWPDPEQQWKAIIPHLQAEMPELLVHGSYQPETKTGPAIWLKCMVASTLPEADWDPVLTPIIYLPSISKADLKDLANADPQLAPLMEYQYTGVIWTHRNGKEWTVGAFLQNKEDGMGLEVAPDNATRYALLEALPKIMEEPNIQYPALVNAEFLHLLLFPNVLHSILEWMCKGDDFIQTLDTDRQSVFTKICQQNYGFDPNPKNIVTIAEKLGMKRDHWQAVWNFYAQAPEKYPEIEEYLRLAKPQDTGLGGLFEVPEDSWPQVNEGMEDDLRGEFETIGKLPQAKAISRIKDLEQQHGKRRSWVWASLGKANLALSLKYLKELCLRVEEPYNALSIDVLKEYYENRGYQVDLTAIHALAEARSEKEMRTVTMVLSVIYTPWLERITRKFPELVSGDSSIFTAIKPQKEESTCLLFVDAFRYDIAQSWAEQMQKKKFKITVATRWTSLPSLTPTCKPAFSPVADRISFESEWNEFRPQTLEKKELNPHQFEAEMDHLGYKCTAGIGELHGEQKCWIEIGKVDQYGHQEQAGLVHRIQELFALIEEKVQDLFAAGFKKITIVTDHGWLLVPGGMPKENLPKDHIETRWGRCALLKEGAPSNLLHLPWF
ncbi:MAG TPA: BREX-1 system phosphatase PglZ type B [Bacteroidales bacterium]|nr:BREX-1 system phosphatase PglZ type B [Bacteroidales bacterium]